VHLRSGAREDWYSRGVFQQFKGTVVNEIMRYVALSCLILFDVGLKLVTAFGNSMPGFLPR